MKLNTSISVEEALQQGVQLPFAYICCYSEVYLGTAGKPVNPDEILEAKFFSEDREIRLFRYNGELNAAELCLENADSTVTEEYEIQNPKFGKSISVKRILSADADGQCYIAETMLCDWKGDKTNG